jgi:hypothetical protein
MTDGELARAIAEFLKEEASTESVASAGGRPLLPALRPRFLEAGNGCRAGTLGKRVEIVFAQETTNMPVWLDILLNLAGYAGFVALATRGASCPRGPADDQIYGDER